MRTHGVTGFVRRLLPHRIRESERGVALLAALLSVALLTLIVLETTESAVLHSHLARNSGNSAGARLLARAAEEGGSAYLGQLLRNREPTTRLTLLPLSFLVLPLGDGDISIRVEDEEGKLNLNQVGDEKHRTSLEALFEELDIDVGLLALVHAWISADEDAGMRSIASGACALAMPCRPRGGPLRSLDELRLIRGFDESTIARLRPYVTAYRQPDGKNGHKGVNADTAPALVLKVIGCDIDADYPLPLQGFGKELPLEDVCAKEDIADTVGVEYSRRSEYFRIHATGRIGDTIARLETLVRRRGDKLERIYWSERPR
jgi:general secretion pathway protein K